MTLQEAHHFFESLKSETTNKSEVRMYDKFLHILSELNNKEFSTDEIQSIEKELDGLNLKVTLERKGKYFTNALRKFEKYLKSTFSLTTKSHYAQLGIVFGSAFGILFGVVFLSDLERSLGISLSLSMGMLVGFFIGKTMDAKALAEGRVL